MKVFNEIVVVEDNTVDGMFISKTLRDSNKGISLLVLDSCERALDYVTSSGEYAGKEVEIPRLLILDLKQPGMSGFQFLSSVRGNSSIRHFPIVVFSDSTADHDRTLAMNLGANGFFTKSVELDSFLRSIREIAHTWLGEPIEH